LRRGAAGEQALLLLAMASSKSIRYLGAEEAIIKVLTPLLKLSLEIFKLGIGCINVDVVRLF